MKKYIVMWIVMLVCSINIVGQKDLISATDFLAKTKEGTDLVILDANKSKNYKAAHIKNAIHIKHTDLYKDGEIKGLIKHPDELALIFGSLGIDMNTPVVITDDGSQKYSSRVYWILKYLGHENVLLLHKDKDLWRKAKIPLTSAVPKYAEKQFIPVLKPEFLATMEEVETAMNKPMTILVDARTNGEYQGLEKKSKGHLPGALHLNYEDLLTENGAFKSVEEIQMLADKLGLADEKEIIFYCKTSVRAAVSFFAFRNILGYDRIKVYDGAYLEWLAKKEIVQ